MVKTNIQWLPEIPDDWKVGKVQDAFRLSKNLITQENPTVLSLARDGVKERDISNNEGQLAASYDGYNEVLPGDLLLNLMDLVSGANCNMSTISGIISPAYLNLRARAGVYPKYFDYYFKTQYWTMAMFAHGKGVSYDHRWTINRNTILNYEIPLPPFDEQKRIADFLDDRIGKIDALIENENKQIEQLKTSRVSIASSLITGGAHHDGSLTSSEQIYWLKSYPQNWRPYPIKYLAKSIRDKYETGLYDYIALKNVESFSGHYVPTDTNSYYSLGGTIKADKNDVIFGKLRPYLAKSLLITKKCCVSSEFAVFRPTELILPEYLQMVFLSKPFVDAVNASTYGTKMPRANISYIENMTLPIPPIDQQKSLIIKNNDVKKTIDLLIDKKEKNIETLADYKKSLIYEYVTGKRRLLS